ncbi:Hypothetical protein NocV09_01801270 [Nannochloropsis oceanica]
MARATRASLGINSDVDVEGLNGDGEEVEEEGDSEGEENGSEEDDDADDDEEEEDDDDYEEEDNEEDNQVPLEASLAFGREKRATMGKRMGGLVGEELDKDETFWGDGKWNIDDAESEYSNESESGDEVDSDFSVSEDEAGAEGEDKEDEEAERNLTAREKRQQQQEIGARSKYKEPKRKARLPPRIAALGAAAAEAALLSSMTPEEVKKLKEERKEATRRRREAALLVPVDRAKRATTQQKTVATQEALAKMGKEEARKHVVKAPRVSKCMFTQEEMLAEACKTEQENTRWLLARKRMQNESDTTAHAPKRQVKLVARFISRRGGYTVINFPEVDLMPAILKGGEGGKEERRKRLRTEDGSGTNIRKCVITGLPARYLDPLTRQPYANREAFKSLRADSQYMPQEEDEGEGEDEDEDEGMGVPADDEEGGVKEELRKGSSMSSSLTNESFG